MSKDNKIHIDFFAKKLELIREGEKQKESYSQLVENATLDKEKEYKFQWMEFLERTKKCLPNELAQFLECPNKFNRPPLKKEFLKLNIPDLYPIYVRAYRKITTDYYDARIVLPCSENVYPVSFGGLRETYKILYFQLRDNVDSVLYDEELGVSLLHIPTLELAMFFSKKFSDINKEYEEFDKELRAKPLSREAQS